MFVSLFCTPHTPPLLPYNGYCTYNIHKSFAHHHCRLVSAEVCVWLPLYTNGLLCYLLKRADGWGRYQTVYSPPKPFYNPQ